MNTAPFQGLLVVELASVLAGPSVGMFFAELGARVIKVENKRTGGDVTRAWKMPQEDVSQPASAYYHSVNWGKEVHFLDLEEETDRLQVLQWIGEADVVVANFKPGSAGSLGMDEASLRALNPKLIYASVFAYTEHDPRPGFDAVIQAETGWIYMNGEPDGKPVKLPVALMDVLAAHQLKEGILVALWQRAASGHGCGVSVSLFDTGVASLANQASNYLHAGILPRRQGSRHPNIAPYGDMLLTKDGQWVMLGIGTQRQWEAFCQLIGRAELLSDPRFATNALRLANRDAMLIPLEEAVAAISLETLMQGATRAGIPLAPIQHLEQVFSLPQARELILPQTEADGSISYRVKSVVFRLSP